VNDATSRQAEPEQRKAVEQEESRDSGMVRWLPGWVTEHPYIGLTVEALLVIALAFAGAPHGLVEAVLLEVAVLGAQGVLWRWGYQRRRLAHWQWATMAGYVDGEMASVDEMKGERFEDYVVLLMTAIGYENARTTGNHPLNKAVDIVATAPGRGLVAVECKRQKHKVNAPVVMKLVGAVNMAPYEGHAPILITNSFLNNVARAKARGVTVYERDGLGDLIAQTRPWMDQQGRAARDFIPEGTDLPSASLPSSLVRSPAWHGKFGAAALSFAGIMTVVLLVQLTTPHRMAPAAAGETPQPSSPASSRTPDTSAKAALRVPAPSEVIRQFYAAISRHDWQQVWLLGGKNLGRGQYASYAGMVVGYRNTVRDVLKKVHVTGEIVTGSFLAYQGDGASRVYQFHYTIRDGVIVAGYQM
jgi:hypothetical protein